MDNHNDGDGQQQSTSSSVKPTASINMGQLLMKRQKQQQIPLMAKDCNSSQSSSNQVASTPANIKRLQVNKWFNSPTDSLFSPCSKKLYNLKNIAHLVNFNDEDDDVDENEN
ncbi:hypothetical protein BLA29_012749, partial [Euroglyphus maynei]